MMQGLLLHSRNFILLNILVFSLVTFLSAPVLAVEPAVESCFWPPGFFLNFGKLKQAQKEIMLSEVEKKLSILRQTGKGLMVRGDLMEKVKTDTPEFNPATILDQSGLVVMVRNFPNIYFNFYGPESLISRNTFIVIKNPRADRLESIIRQSLVLTGDFFAFSQVYFKATIENLQKSLNTQPPQNSIVFQESEKGKRRKKP